jgi:hypothetical protein
MHEILHIIGLCPDSFMHIDLIDIFIANYESLIHFKFSHLYKNKLGKRCHL